MTFGARVELAESKLETQTQTQTDTDRGVEKDSLSVAERGVASERGFSKSAEYRTAVSTGPEPVHASGPWKVR